VDTEEEIVHHVVKVQVVVKEEVVEKVEVAALELEVDQELSENHLIKKIN